MKFHVPSLLGAGALASLFVLGSPTTSAADDISQRYCRDSTEEMHARNELRIAYSKSDGVKSEFAQALTACKLDRRPGYRDCNLIFLQKQKDAYGAAARIIQEAESRVCKPNVPGVFFFAWLKQDHCSSCVGSLISGR